MATVFSYCRFSSKKQELGDSLRRQLALGQAWMKRYPEHQLDQSLRLRDLGISAFRGGNLDKSTGDLGKFIDLAKQGRIPPGSILMLENLDRFSRQPPRKAYQVFCELVEAGVKILTLDPEQLIDSSNIDDMSSTLTVIIKMQLSYEESRKKSERVGAYWKNARIRAAEDGTPFNSRRPSWLNWEDGVFTVKPGADKAIGHIFARTVDGLGERSLLTELNKLFRPLGRSGKWNTSFVQKVLSDRAVLGELQPYQFVDGVRQPVGDPIPNYYPALIDPALFHQAQHAKLTRTKKRGPTAEFCNLFTGLVVCSLDKHPMHLQTSRIKRKNGSAYVQRRFLSYGHWRKLPGACPISVDYYSFEHHLLDWLDEVKAKDVIPDAKEKGPSFEKLSAELAGVNLRLKDLQETLQNPRMKLDTVLTAVEGLEKRRGQLQKELEHAQRKVAVAESHPLKQTKTVLELLRGADGTEAYGPLRNRLRAVLANLIDRIWAYPFKLRGTSKGNCDGKGVGCLVQVNFQSGIRRCLLMTRKHCVHLAPDTRHTIVDLESHTVRPDYVRHLAEILYTL